MSLFFLFAGVYFIAWAVNGDVCNVTRLLLGAGFLGIYELIHSKGKK